MNISCRPRIIEYIDLFLKDLLADERPTSTLKSIEFENGTELMNLCYTLPKGEIYFGKEEVNTIH